MIQNRLTNLQRNLLARETQQDRQQQGKRFLQFSLKENISGLVPLKDLYGTIKVSLKDILPVPQVAEHWLGITNYQGEAIWILDFLQLLDGHNWLRREPFALSGMIMLVKIEERIIGLLVEQIQGIEIYYEEDCLPIAEVDSNIQMMSFFKGYFLNNRHESSFLLDINRLISWLKI